LESAAGDCVRGKTILIAEDEPDLLEIMSETLKEFSMNVLTAKNGNEALVVQDEYQDKIDFLLTDMVMPEMGGLKLAELIKEVRPETHVVFMSGYPVRGEIASVNLPKDAVFMAKPVKPDYLRNVLKQVANGGLDAKTDATIWKA
jgi:DNA-binding NtrC family response regulator